MAYPAHAFRARLVDAVRGAAQKRGYPHMRPIVSGAGHDACTWRAAPAAMIFVPCKDGISHNEIEDATPDSQHRWRQRAVAYRAGAGRRRILIDRT